jgi:hypothetical protein
MRYLISALSRAPITYQARAVNKKKGFTPEKILFRFNVQRTCAPA